jgi:hypothetical protein
VEPILRELASGLSIGFLYLRKGRDHVYFFLVICLKKPLVYVLIEFFSKKTLVNMIIKVNSNNSTRQSIFNVFGGDTRD